MAKNILLIGGSLNQTTMMHQIANHLPDHRCAFSPFFDDGTVGRLGQKGLLEFTILGGRHRKATETYLAENKLPIDDGGKQCEYDLVITCTDLLVPKRIQGKKLVLVQEGMTEPENISYHMVRWLGLPRYLANTAATGLSHSYNLFCVASQGYRDLFIKKGVRPEKLAVTGIPNFDHVRSYLRNDFPYRNYVLAATSSNREAFKPDNRAAFIRKVQGIAAGRDIIFKLHPNENIERARREIEQFAPEAKIFHDGNTNHMIANCDVLVTQTSSVTYIGLALGKEVYSDLNLADLRRLMPVQNDGASAGKIAELCRRLIDISITASPKAAPLAGSLSRRKVFDSL